MSDYSQITFFTPKDSLSTGNSNKIIYGSDVDAEFSAISTAIATKADVDGDAIGAGTPATEINVDNLKLDANKIISTNTDGDIELEPNGTGTVVITNIDVAAGEIDGTAIGANSASTGAFTTLTASGDVNFDGGTFFVDASADAVGIGTTSPAVDLQVGNGSGLYQASISGGGYDLVLGASGGNIFGFASQSISTVFNTASVPLGIGTNASHPLILGTAATEQMRIDAVGNVGIGTTNPGEKLAVHGDSGNIVGVFETSTGNTNRLWLGATSTESYIDATAGVGATNMVFKVASTERARIDSSGNVGIGENSPASKLHINSGTADQGVLVESTDTRALIGFKDDTTVTNPLIGGAGDDLVVRTGNAERMRIDSSGTLLVGTTVSDPIGGNVSGFTVGDFGTGRGKFMHTGSNHTLLVGTGTSGVGSYGVGFYYHNGTSANLKGSIVINTGSVNYNTTSDQRLKENIVDAPSASDDIDAIQVRSFDWKADGSHQRYGMVAQELLEVAPEAVHQPDDPEEMMGVDYSKLVPMLVKEIQSLRARVHALESK